MLKGLWGRVFFGTVTLISIGACREVEIGLDPSLSKMERERVQTDLKTLEQLKIDPHQTRWFYEIFVAPSSIPQERKVQEHSVADHLFRYLDDRIQYILPAQMQVQFDFPPELDRVSQSAAGFSIARNVGTSMYFQVRLLGKPYGLFEVDGKSIPIRSTRVGLIQLGEGFTEKRTPSGVVIDSLFRAGTLVHEARHSDCSGGLTEQALEEHRSHLTLSDPSCGHIHTICPPGHEHAKTASCESHPWGAFSVEAIFFQAIAEACKQCSVKQKQAAKMIALDRLSRLDQAMAQKMFGGQLGKPIMTPPPEEKTP